jgi:fumarate hydratase, class II
MDEPGSTRIETDSFVPVEVPAKHYWGAQTQRSLGHFAIGPQTMPLAIIHALAMVKRAAAEVNRDLGLLPAGLCSAIAAAREIETGRLDAEFPLRVWQTGSGTPTNMNVNEVIANRAKYSAPRGAQNSRCIQNDHVNLGQSSNDCFPTAMHIAAVRQIKQGLEPALRALHQALLAKSEVFAAIVTLGRTHLFKIADDIRLTASGPAAASANWSCRKTNRVPRSCRARSIRPRPRR